MYELNRVIQFITTYRQGEVARVAFWGGPGRKRGQITMERRDYLKAAGGIGATTLLGGAGLFASTRGARASGGVDYGEVTVTSDDGTVDHVSIYGDSEITWDGFENPAETVDVTIEAKVDGETNYQELYTTSADLTQDSWGGSGEDHSGVGTSGTISSDVGLDENGNHDPDTDWAIVQASDYDDPYGIPTNEDAIDASVLEVDNDGESADYSITVRAIYDWKRADGTTEFSDNFTSSLDVTVENEPRTASGSSGDGEDGSTAG